MFSFHRPKVYRSSTGCCICKAKSSSSRFTDSKKYEEDFIECFKLSEPRQGEICNACVLLVKRWKKLPAGSERNWKHVVDARAGPGMKSISKFKSKLKKLEEMNAAGNSCDAGSKLIKKKKQQFEREAREFSPLSDKSDDVDMHDESEEYLCEEGVSGGSSRAASPRGEGGISSDGELETHNGHGNVGAGANVAVALKSRRHKSQAKRRDYDDEGLPAVSDFISMDYWKKETVCCGTIFKGMCGEIIVDPRFLKACNARLAQHCKLGLNATNPKSLSKSTDGIENTNPITGAPQNKLFSDSSSDSGYDESSNQGVGGAVVALSIIDNNGAFKTKEHVTIEEMNGQLLATN